jgi:hypothetical protein
MTSLAAINADDRYLDTLGQGEALPIELQDELSRVLLGWVKEARDTPWTQPPLQLPGS